MNASQKSSTVRVRLPVRMYTRIGMNDQSHFLTDVKMVFPIFLAFVNIAPFWLEAFGPVPSLRPSN
jgi:hypothetical protein